MISDICSQAGASNTPLNSQKGFSTPKITNPLEPAIDYLSFWRMIVAPTEDEAVKLLEDFVVDILMFVRSQEIFDDWVSQKKSSNYIWQKAQYAKHKAKLEKLRQAQRDSITLEFRFDERPFQVAKGIYATHRITTMLPLSGGFDILQCEDSETGVDTVLIKSFFRVSGQFFDALTIDKMQDLVVWLADIGIEPSRLDLRLDDSTFEHIPKQQIEAAILAGQYSGFSSAPYHGDLLKQEDNSQYLGSRRSNSYIRLYPHITDKDSNSRVSRWEREIKGRECKETWSALVNVARKSSQQFLGFIASTSIGGVDFVDRKLEKNAKRQKNLVRCQKLDWWIEFLDLVGGANRCKAPVQVWTMQGAERWLSYSVCPTLLCMVKAIGWGAVKLFLDSHFAQIEDRGLKPLHKLKIKSWKTDRAIN